ncbi:3D domain-containing protein [Paenibacillus sp. FA6]|uniref:3D domain-containing protein n=1 Tax=Paenibacillus sp. FA6 TaxID=3413029 RepID=UPI003F655B84
MNIKFKSIKMFAAAIGIAMVVQSTPVHAESVHVTKDGDTFFKLSQQYGVDLNKLINANSNTNENNIYAGINLTIPTAKNTVSAATVNSTASILNVSDNQKVVEAWGKTFNYSKTLNVKASAYSAAASENGKWGAVDYFGNPLKLGTIAVDPKIIPMGTKVLVTGHSHDGLPKDAFVATATDAGSAIKGNRIDIFIPGSQQSVRVFGYQEIELYFIN